MTSSSSVAMPRFCRRFRDLPPNVSVVLGSNEIKEFRAQNYFYYYKQLKESFLLQQQNFDATQRPMPNGLDGHGRWSEVAKQMLEEHDHLGRVANIRKTQIKKLEKSGITTLSQLADAEELAGIAQ